MALSLPGNNGGDTPVIPEEDPAYLVPAAETYYLSLKTNEELDATTVTKDNFTVTTAGVLAPVVDRTVYLPQEKEVRIYLNKNIGDYVSVSPYIIAANGVKNTDGEVANLTGSSYLKPEVDGIASYDMSISNIWFKQYGTVRYYYPTISPCEMYVRVVNSSFEEKTATLRIYAMGDAETKRVINEEVITLAQGEEFTGFYEVSFEKGEILTAELVK